MRKRPSSLLIHLTAFHVRHRCGRNHGDGDGEAVVKLREFDVICKYKPTPTLPTSTGNVEEWTMREQGCRMFACPPQWQWPLHICEPHLTEELAQGQEREKDLSLNKEGERPKGCTTTRPIPNPLTLPHSHSSASLCYQ